MNETLPEKHATRLARPSGKPPVPWDAAHGRHEAYRAMDRMQAAMASKLTGGLSPAGLALAGVDWWMHLAMAPGKQMALAEKAARKAARLWIHFAATAALQHPPPSIEPVPDDREFADPLPRGQGRSGRGWCMNT